MKLGLTKISLGLLFAVFTLVNSFLPAVSFFPSLAWAAPGDKVEQALSVRHMDATKDQLEALAGGSDALVKQLLKLRTQERPMFVGVRAQRLLLSYADKAEVAEALESDMRSANLLGLARLIVVHIDKVSDSAARERLARAALERAKADNSFTQYARMLIDSSDSQVSKIAREALK